MDKINIIQISYFINTQHFFSIDEIVSIELFICLLIVGIGTLSINDISFRNIAAILFIIALAFISDTNMGAGAGITMGIILGFATGNLMESIAIYGACGETLQKSLLYLLLSVENAVFKSCVRVSILVKCTLHMSK